MSSPFRITEHTIPCSHIREYAQATATTDAPLQLCVKQYVPHDNVEAKWGDITLVATHGSGMPKVCTNTIRLFAFAQRTF
jgi:hypothetical protein